MKKPGASTIALAGVLLFLYAPIALLVVYSFNDSRFGTAWRGFTFDWYARLFSSQETARALVNTIVVSTTSTLIAVALGTMLAVALHFYRFRGRGVLDALLYVPVVMPDIVTAVATLAFFVTIHLPLGRGSIIVAHVVFQTVFVVFVLRARLQQFPRAVIEAARDLGATELGALRLVVLPLLRPGLVAAALIALALSIDDFVITYFVAGPGASTLPVRIYSMVKRGVTPDVNALSTVMLIVTVIAIVFATRAGVKQNSEAAS